MEYNESKKSGDIGENEILKRIQKKYPKAYIDNKGKANSDWDIYIPEINQGIEVKQDYESFYTNNIVIEVEMNGKLSALSKTKATYWVFITGLRYIWITPLQIYRLLEQHFEYNRVLFTGKGDNKAKFAYLVSHNVLLKHVYGLNKEDGWVDMIEENDPMHRNNFISLGNRKMEKEKEIFDVWNTSKEKPLSHEKRCVLIRRYGERGVDDTIKWATEYGFKTSLFTKHECVRTDDRLTCGTGKCVDDSGIDGALYIYHEEALLEHLKKYEEKYMKANIPITIKEFIDHIYHFVITDDAAKNALNVAYGDWVATYNKKVLLRLND